VEYGNTAELEEKLKSGDVAAFIVEPIQGEGGIIVPPEGYLKSAQELCHRYGALLIVDEIQTGFGRTGKMFACEHEGVEPDIMCLAKSLGGGIMPVGAFIATGEVWNKAYGGIEKCLLHTSTFGGNTRAMAAGLATLEFITRENLPERAARLGDYLLSGLRRLQEKYALIKEVRGRGLLLGIEFEQPAKGVLARIAGAVNKISQEYLASMVAGFLLNNHRIITAYTLNNPNVIRLEPPLIISEEQLDILLNALEDTFAKNRSFLGFGLASGKTILAGRFGGKDR